VTAPPLRKNRDFLILWSGQVVSTIGSEVTGIAFPLLVLAVTHSPSQAGIVGFAATLPNLLFYLPAGAIVDRVDRKRLMLTADAARIGVLGGLGLALASGRFSLLLVAAAAFVDGTCGVFFRLAESAALPQVVPREQLTQAVAQNQARQQGAGVASQPLGGFLFSVGHSVPFLFDAVSYAVSFVSLLFVRPAFQEEREPARTRMRADIAEGVTWLWRHAFLRTTMFLIAGTNFAHAALFLVLIVRARELGASPARIGAMLALFSVGAIVGSLLAPRVSRSVRPPVLIIGSLWLWAGLTAALVLAHSALLLGALAGLQALVGPSWNVVLAKYRYTLVPDRLLGRVASAGSLVTWGTIPLGSLAAGYLIAGVGARETFLVLAGVFVVVAAAAVASQPIRDATMPE
jgi:MFS family permease